MHTHRLFGTDESVRRPYMVEYGFDYSGKISFIANASDGGEFTQAEEKEVIAILQSFRVNQ